MNPIIEAIDGSTFDPKVKDALRTLADTYFALRAEEADALEDMHKARASINERQYAKRLGETMSDQERKELHTHQFAWRAWFANGVLRTHQARINLVRQALEIRRRVKALQSVRGVRNQAALVALMKLARDAEGIDVDGILKEFDNVSDISRDRILDAVRTIYKDKLERTGLLADISFSSAPVLLTNPTETQVALIAALKPAYEIRARFEELWGCFLSAKSKHNVPQFTQRIEQAFAAGDEAKMQTVLRERKSAETTYFLAAMNYAGPYGELRRIADKLKLALQNEAFAIRDKGDFTSIEAMTSMTNYIGSWKWLNELNSYIEGKYKQCDPEGALRALDFNVKDYLES